jgi:hypothetical protein
MSGAAGTARRELPVPLNGRAGGRRTFSRVVLVAGTALSLSTASLHAQTDHAKPDQAQADAAPDTVHHEPGAPTPSALAELVLGRFASGPVEAFDSVYPYADARSLVVSARRQEIPLRAAAARVVRVDGDSATLLLAGYPEFDNSGDETIYARLFSGIYRAARDPRGWHLVQRIPPDRDNRIHHQTLDVTVTPGRGLLVRDTLAIAVAGDNGFWVYLNHGARLQELTLDGGPATHVLSGGLLWVEAPPSASATLVIAYDIDVARDSLASPNSGRFTDDYGHVRAQYFWHPFFDFHSAGDRSPLHLTVRIPDAYHLVTGLPQTDTVAEGVRVVAASSREEADALTLMYDRDWEPTRHRLGSGVLDLMLPQDFEPSPDSVAAAVQHAYRVLSGRFGEPHSPYLAVANGRARGSGGWEFRSNDLIAGSGSRARSSRAGSLPRTWLGHEVAHGWTHPTGPGANTLSEGWAVFAEWVILTEQYGSEAVEGYWEHYRNLYDAGDYEGRVSILEDPNNAGIAYRKGAWVFWMLHQLLGEDAFAAGLRRYMAIPRGEPAGMEEFTRALSDAAGWDLSGFLQPWLEEKHIPDLRWRLEEERLIVEQHGPLFTLPLEMQLATSSGPVRRTLHLAQRADTLDVRELGAVTDMRLDPERRFLLRRHRGDVVRLELRAPDASRVRVTGDFAGSPVEAKRFGDLWRVELSLAEGRYVVYGWEVDGEYRPPEGDDVVIVSARRPLAESQAR